VQVKVWEGSRDINSGFDGEPAAQLNNYLKTQEGTDFLFESEKLRDKRSVFASRMQKEKTSSS